MVMNSTTKDMNSDMTNLPQMQDKHYYLVREAGSEEIQLVYIFSSFTYSNGVTDYDISTKVFYKQQKWGLWGWNCGSSVISFEQSRKFEEILAEVTQEEVDALFDVMREATDELTRWKDDSWEPLTGDHHTVCRCMYESGKYPYFTFINDETHEQVCLWSDLFIHGIGSDCPLAPDGSWGTFYAIPESVFEKASELHKAMSTKFVRHYRDFVQAKTGRLLPIKEYTPEEIDAKIVEQEAELERYRKEHQAFLAKE